MRRARKRGNGEGTTYRVAGRRTKPWAAALVVGWTLAGKPIRRARFASSEADAKKLLAEMRRARDAGREIPDDRITVGGWLARWLERASVKPTTYRTWRYAVSRFILPAVGTVPLRRLRSSQVTALMSDMAAAGLSPHTIRGVRSVLRAALADAERDGLIESNAARLARISLPPVDPAPIPTPDEMRRLLAALEGHRLAPLYRLAAATGLRLGEITGLRLGDVEDRRLVVRVQLQATRNAAEPFVLTTPKTAGSERIVPLGPTGLAAISAAKAQRARDQLAAGRGWRDRSDLLFTTADGDPLHPNTVRYVLAEGQKRAGIAPFPVHSLRRFAATLQEQDRSAAKALLGHTTEAMTERYVGMTDAAAERALARIEEAIG